MEVVVSPMITAITDGVATVITMLGSVVTALVGTSGALAPILPVVGLGIGFACTGLAIGYIRRMIFGW